MEIDGEEVGRINLELFGEEAPKTVNNFLALCSGDYNPFFRYKGSMVHDVRPGLFFRAGDIIHGNGLGTATVYDNKATIASESNKLKFSEPYLLAAAANEEGQVGC